MKKKFNNINEELDRIKTLIFETDNFINNGTPINESSSTEMDEDKLKVDTDAGKFKFKTKTGKFKISTIGNNQYKIKGKGAGQFLDDKGEISKEGYDFIEKALPQIGIKFDTSKVIVRLGNKEKNTADVDKIFFTLVDKKNVYAVKNDKTLTKLSDIDLDKKEEVKTAEVTKKAEQSTPTTATSSTTTQNSSDLKGKTLKEAGLDLSKLLDATDEMHRVGFTRGDKYYIDQNTKTVYSLDKTGKIDYVFMRNKGTTTATTKESFNMDMIFINPLLFESVLLEQEGSSNDYYMKDNNRLSQHFTDTVDAIVSGKPAPEKPKTGETTKSGWDNYPCVAKNPAMTKGTMSNGSIAYQDKANTYYSNGRFKDKTGAMGNYHCDGEKIVSDKKTTTEPIKPKYIILTKEDLVGDTNRFEQYLHQINDLGMGIGTLLDTLGINLANITLGRRKGVKGVVDALDGWVDEGDLVYVLQTIKALDNKYYYDESVEIPQYITATEEFLRLYQEDEGEDLISDIDGVGTETLKTGAEELEQQIIATINRQVKKEIPSDLQTKESGSEKNV